MLIGTELAIEVEFYSFYSIDGTFEISARGVNFRCGGLYEKIKKQKKAAEDNRTLVMSKQLDI